jgi:hypothetical protein
VQIKINEYPALFMPFCNRLEILKPVTCVVSYRSKAVWKKIEMCKRNQFRLRRNKDDNMEHDPSWVSRLLTNSVIYGNELELPPSQEPVTGQCSDPNESKPNPRTPCCKWTSPAQFEAWRDTTQILEKHESLQFGKLSERRRNAEAFWPEDAVMLLFED